MGAKRVFMCNVGAEFNIVQRPMIIMIFCHISSQQRSHMHVNYGFEPLTMHLS